MSAINQSSKGIVFIINANNQLIASVTDGDIRRGLLNGLSIDDPIESIMSKNPIKVGVNKSKREILSMMILFKRKQIPIVCESNYIVDVMFYEDLIKDTQLDTIPLSIPDISDLELQYIKSSVESTWISTAGDNIELFEKKLSGIFKSKYVVAMNSGTSALHTALLTLDIGLGDEVIVPGLSFIATANVVKYCGAEPVFCDINKETWNIDENQLEKLINKKTKAIIIVHLLGNPVNIRIIKKICKKYRIKIIEDAAQSFGSKINKKLCGTLGDYLH